MFENEFFDPDIVFPKNIVLQLQNGIFTSGIPPILLPDEFFESLMYTFSKSKSAPKKDTTHMYIFPLVVLVAIEDYQNKRTRSFQFARIYSKINYIRIIVLK